MAGIGIRGERRVVRDRQWLDELGARTWDDEAALGTRNRLGARWGGRSPEDYADHIAILAEPAPSTTG